jgi:hypothetical protein
LLDIEAIGIRATIEIDRFTSGRLELGDRRWNLLLLHLRLGNLLHLRLLLTAIVGLLWEGDLLLLDWSHGRLRRSLCGSRASASAS